MGDRRKPALSLLQSSLLTVLCSTSGNRRNEEHYSGGWKTPLITSRRAVRYPPDLPLPRPVVCGSPKLPSHFLGEDRRDYARALGRCVTPPVLRLLFHIGVKWAGPGRRRAERSRGDGQQHEGGKDQARDFRTMEMDIGVLERDREELKFQGGGRTEEGRRG